MAAVALFPSLAAEIVATPATRPVTVPFASTLAIDSFDDVHAIVRPANALPLASRGVAVNFAVAPTNTSPVVGERSMEATATTGGGLLPPPPAGGGEAGVSEPHAVRTRARVMLAAVAAKRMRYMVVDLQAVTAARDPFASAGGVVRRRVRLASYERLRAFLAVLTSLLTAPVVVRPTRSS